MSATAIRTVLVVLAVVVSAGCQSLGVGGAPAPARATEMDARSETLYLSIIGELVINGKHHAALAHVASFEMLYGRKPRSVLLSADAWLALRELGKAEEAYSALLDGTLSGEAFNGLGHVAAARANLPAAAKHFESAVRVQPTNVRFLTGLGTTLSALERYDEAEFALRQAFELAPGDDAVKSSLQEMLRVSGRGDKIPALFGTAPGPVAARVDQTSFPAAAP
jgi:Flp pilus assembly protein TadD